MLSDNKEENMTKQEFLEELKQALSGEVSAETMMDSYRYYASYIDEEIRKGKTEAQVIDELGKPSLIARSIIAAQEGERVVDEEYTEDGKTRRMTRKKSTKQNGNESKKEFQFTFNADSWYAKVLFVAILILVIMLVFCIIKGLFWLFIQIGIPILIVLGIIYLVMYFTK